MDSSIADVVEVNASTGTLTVVVWSCIYHRGSDTLPVGTLRQILAATRWAEEDLQRLGLVK